MTPAELYEMDGADWLAARVGEDAQPSESILRWDPERDAFIGPLVLMTPEAIAGFQRA